LELGFGKFLKQHLTSHKSSDGFRW